MTTYKLGGGLGSKRYAYEGGTSRPLPYECWPDSAIGKPLGPN
jgi:hypothetical protein